jgi:hypothetical protein
MKATRWAGVATAALTVGVLGLVSQAPITSAASSSPDTVAAETVDLAQGWVQASEGKAGDGKSKVKEFVNAKTKGKVKIASTDDDATITVAGKVKDAKDASNKAEVVLSQKGEDKATAMKNGGPKTYGRDTVKEQLKAVSGMTDDQARAWLADLYPEDQPDGAAKTAAKSADGSTTNTEAHAAINPALMSNPAAVAVPASGTAGLNIYVSGCMSNDIDWYWHEYGCYYATLDKTNGADWYLGEYQKASGTVNGWYRRPYKVQTYIYHGPNNTIIDYSPYYTRNDSGPGCSTQTIALTIGGFASHNSSFQVCQGKIQPVNGGPFLWYGGWTGGAEWVGNSFSLPDRTYGIEDVQMIHSPPNASYGNRQFHMYGEWSGGSNWK